MIGEAVSHYRVLEELSGGGMGVFVVVQKLPGAAHAASQEG
jgi:hypothetical protein